MLSITFDQFRQYLIDVKGYNLDEVKEIYQEIRTCGTPVQDYLTQEELAECVAYNN